MPVTTLDANTALVVIDMQKGIVTMQTAHLMGDVQANVVRLVDAFRKKERPVVLVHVGFAPDGADALKTRVQQPPPGGQRPADFFEYIDERSTAPISTCNCAGAALRTLP